MIRDLENNNWEVFGVKIYAPNIKTALERALKRDLHAGEKLVIKRKLKEME